MSADGDEEQGERGPGEERRSQVAGALHARLCSWTNGPGKSGTISRS